MLRSFAGVVVGGLVIGVVVGGLQALGASVHPLPDGLDVLDPASADEFAAYIATMPLIVWAIAMSSELLGAFLGALAAGWIARDRARIASAIVVGIAVLGSLNNWRMFDHPVWFMVGQLVLYPVVLMSAWVVLGRLGTPQAGVEASA